MGHNWGHVLQAPGIEALIVPTAIMQHQKAVPQRAHLIEAAAVLAEPGKGLLTHHCVNLPQAELQPMDHLGVALALGIAPARVELVNGPIRDVAESGGLLGLVRKTAIAIVTKAIALRVNANDLQRLTHRGVVLRVRDD